MFSSLLPGIRTFLLVFLFQVSFSGIHAQIEQPRDHEYYLTLLSNAKDSVYQHVIQIYDEYAKAHPEDYKMRMEKCKLIQNAYYDYDEEYNPKEDECRQCMEEVLRDFPQEPDVMLFKTDFIYGDSALTYLEKVLASYRDNPDTWKNKAVWQLYNKLALQYSYNKDKSLSAIRCGEMAMNLNDTLDISIMMAKQYRSVNKNEAAVKVLVKYLDSTDAAWVLNQKGSLLLELGEPQKALVAFGYARKDTGAWQEAGDMAQALVEAGLYKEARFYLVKDTAKSWNKTPSLKKLFDYDLKYGFESAAAIYGKIVEEDFWNDPLGVDRLRLLAGFPLAPWSFLDGLRILLLLLTLAAIVIVPYVFILPIHYLGGYFKNKGMILPANEFRWGLRHLWLAISLVLFADLITTLLFDYDLFLSYAAKSDTENPINLKAAHLAVCYFLLVLSATLCLLKKSDLKLFFGKFWSWQKSLRLGIGMAFVLRFALGLVIGMFKVMGYKYSPMTFLSVTEHIQAVNKFYSPALGFLFVVILVPIYEEILFRGIFLSAAEKHMKFIWANILQAAAFATLHLDLKLFLFYFAFGAAAGIYRNKSQSLAPGIATHITNNLIAFIAITALSNRLPIPIP